MRKFSAMAGMAALLIIVPLTPAQAEGTIVIGDGTCTGFVPLNGGLGPILEGGRVHVVTKGSWSTLTCHLDIPDHLLPPKTVRAFGVQCFTPLGFTNDTRMQATRGGRAVGTCRVRN